MTGPYAEIVKFYKNIVIDKGTLKKDDKDNWLPAKLI